MRKIIISDLASAIIRNQDDEILLQKKDLEYIWSPGYWCMFGGGIKSNETPLKALKRELREEIGIYISIMNKPFRIQQYEHLLPKKIKRGVQYIFIADFYGNLSNIHISEGNGFAFFSKKEIIRLENIVHCDKLALMDYFA